jgi:hypothetical protein
MKPDATSLDRLHDLAPPPEVGWWPLASGWYVLSGITLLVLLYLAHRTWRNWQANAYRRAALHELGTLDDATAIAELLRRTALAVAPRSVIANATGPDWIAWLSAQCPNAMPTTVSAQLTQGIYSHTPDEDSIQPLREYASRWITGHQTTCSNRC